ncbi:B-box zinc finger protein 22 isoform X2 [Amborella trichopoda]|uniref:B box-type domain-containing protein n=1 Tax=Amborella trichopoda TaxID=13333 RepID=W1NWX0_AMBTC|nr:B-box zinc finger protein 22 isoform X2 [Amborella trichopoda]ERM99780.1 hypothetical protein AMTR_s00099p00149290 [Amborella trichopoda]|eukprot:XP_006836927.1 B-box zinc finger protein 22 isoform X2 [Amborella trichopoda]
MKIQCDVCEKAEAAVLCCADEAALCWSCDETVHAANKLASKHQRVPLLLNSSHHANPKCDICQEKSGFFFCLEDRALLCRQCDVSIHTHSPYVSSHQRFLLTGVKVGLNHHTSPTPQDSKNENLPNSALPRDQAAGVRPQWPLDEIFSFPDFDHLDTLSDCGSSQISTRANNHHHQNHPFLHHQQN